MEDLIILFVLFGGVFALVFIITTLNRLRSHGDLIERLRTDIQVLREELRLEKQENSEIKSIMRERFDDAKESAARAVVTDPSPEKPEEGDPIAAEVKDQETQEEPEATEIQLQPKPEEETSPARAVTPPPLPKSVVTQKFAETSTAESASEPESKSPPPPPVPETASQPGKLKEILKRIYLWPPSGDSAAEATIVGWWATRLALIVGIITATFTGIHVAESVPAWLRVTGLGALAVVMMAGGVWIERSISAFGRLISAGGLGLGYFTAFAAFALKPMQIIESPAMAVVVQAVMVGVMVGWSLWRRDELIAGMATVLGYVSCWFSLQHDQLNFVIVGLLLLAAAGSFMLWRRKWLWPQGFAIVGTWGGFFALSFFEWTPTSAPMFAAIVGCFALAAAIFEAGHYFTGPNLKLGTEPAKWLKRFSVASSSLAILVGFYVFTDDYATLKSWFYLVFTVLMLGFSMAHYFRKHEISRGVDQMFFLKASALLCLYFVAEFDGPIRWMSLALQAGAMLWAWKRTRYTWVEVGFAVLFFVSLTVMARGIFEQGEETWIAFGTRNLVGILSLLALSLWTALHREWRFPDFEDSSRLKWSFNPLYVAGSAGIGLVAWLLCNIPHADYFDKWRSVLLLIAGVVIAAPLLRWVKAGPFIAATTALFAGFLKIMITSGRWEDDEVSSVCLLGFVIAIVVAELCRRFWPEHWKLGNTTRTLYAGFGAVLFFLIGQSVVSQFRIADEIAAPVCIIAFAGVGALLLWQNSKLLPTQTTPVKSPWPWLLAILIGVLVSILSIEPTFLKFNHVWLTVGAAILFASAFLTRNTVPVVAGGIPLVFATLGYLFEFDRRTNPADHCIAAFSILATTVAIAIVFFRQTREIQSDLFRAFEAILHGIGLLVIHWLLRNVFNGPLVFFVDCALALGVLFLSRVFPMRALKFSSALPLAYGVLHVLMIGFGLYEAGEKVWWWGAAAISVAWCWLYHQGPTLQLPNFSRECPEGKITFGWPTGLLTVALWFVAFHGSNEPWMPVAFAGFGLLVLLLWRFEEVEAGQVWTWLLLASSAVGAVSVILKETDSPAYAFASVMITTALIALHGLFYSRRELQYRNLVIFHSIPALGLAFWASSPGVLIIDELTTVVWGIASITLFVLGFIFGLRVYRIVGLVGIGLSLARVFIVDIEDTLYRIYASFAVTIVLLAVGFLYIKFRNRIENGPFSDKTAE